MKANKMVSYLLCCSATIVLFLTKAGFIANEGERRRRAAAPAPPRSHAPSPPPDATAGVADAVNHS